MRLEVATLPQDRERVQSALENLACFLTLLPLSRLESVRVTGDLLELHFDFGRKESKTIEIPAQRSVVLQPDDERDPLEGGQAIASRRAARRVVLQERIRFRLGPHGLAGVVPGDLQVEWGLFSFDLDLHVETGERRFERDEHGRVVLALDALGQPRREGTRFVADSFEQWLVLEAAGRRVEIGLS